MHPETGDGRLPWEDLCVDETEVHDITVDRARGVEIAFADGHVCRFELEELRLACPCAACRKLRDDDQAPWPTPRSPLPLSIVDAELNGAWGLSITWNDGHATGIYPWEALRRWCDRRTQVEG
jgi:prepilin-type processing-associated H-X9-DG protein